MIERLIAVSLGALATWLALFFLKPVPGDTSTYAIVAVIGAVVAFLWPLVFGLYIGRRARDRRQDQISAEVDRQMAEERARQAGGR